MEYEKYTKIEEDEYTNVCIDHRTKLGLSITIDMDDIDCECGCRGYSTCPLNPKNKGLLCA